MRGIYDDEERSPVSLKRWATIIVGVILLVILATSATRIFENVPADKVVVIQSPVSGSLTWYTTPGLKWQGMGKVTSYNKSFQYWFSSKKDQGSKNDESIGTTFNDGGHATVSGSVRIDMPLEPDKLTALHSKYGSQEAIEKELVRPAFERSIYMSGPLMSSAESYSERRNQFIHYIEDQASLGLFKTTTHLQRTKDPISGNEKTVNIVQLVADPKSPGGYSRSEESPIATFGLHAYNLSINDIKYDEQVEKQIQTQQQAIMQIQTAIAESRKAEQKALTAEQEGRAEATKTKWAQEAIKAQAVTEGEQKKDVARLSKEAAEFYKQEQILKGEGDAAYKKAVIEADGALAQKLDTYKTVMGGFAREFGRQKWVPEVVMGSESGKTGDQVTQMMSLLSVKAMKDLGLDLRIPSTKPTALPVGK
jgi:hypothetical protein